MTAIEASSVSLKTMADGTLRVTFDIEPRFAKDAFGLFGAPGTPCALAALRVGAPAPPVPEKPKGGPLAKLAGRWCQDPQFQSWMEIAHKHYMPDMGQGSVAMVRDAIYLICNIESRADLDNNKDAATCFELLIRAPYMAHLGRIE